MKERKACKVDTCDTVQYKRSPYCRAHDRAWRLYGDPLVSKRHTWSGLDLRKRWLKYVIQGEGCWVWVGAKDQRGYGRLSVRNYPVLAHRLAWQLFCGSISEGKHVLHKCNNPSCVNPDHLYLGTQKQNVRDMIQAGNAGFAHLKGAEHGMAKLTDADVYAIRASAEKDSVLARHYNVSRATIYDIRRQKIWRHLL